MWQSLSISPTTGTAWRFLPSHPVSIQMLYTGLFFTFALPVLTVVWFLGLRPLLLRRFYERQGIVFVDNCHPLIGAELEVSKLHRRNKSHDSLYLRNDVDVVGTIRSWRIQLYTISAEASERVVQQTGHGVDRNTPALDSFGRLSPYAITFAPVSEPYFRERKASLTRGLNDMKRLFGITNRMAGHVIHTRCATTIQGGKLDVRDLLEVWTRETSGEFIWSKNNIEQSVQHINRKYETVSVPFMTALNQTFTDLRFQSSKFGNRIFISLAAWPLDKEARRLSFNVRVLRQEMTTMMSSPIPGTVAERVQRENEACGIPPDMTRDDLVTATIAGLDTVKFSTMSTVWNLLLGDSSTRKESVLGEIRDIQKDPENLSMSLGHCPTLNAVVYESLRREPPGSLINNVATEDFSLQVGARSYKIQSGTRIVPCIHALHLNKTCWSADAVEKMAALDKFDPSRFLEFGDGIVGSPKFMPFGKGLRRCPGQGPGLLLVKTFIMNLLLHRPNCMVEAPPDQSLEETNFNIMSRATFLLVP